MSHSGAVLHEGLIAEALHPQLRLFFQQAMLLQCCLVFLMKAFKATGVFRPSWLKILNQCRMFQNVITLADITNAEGTRISLRAYEGMRLESHLHRYEWPRSPKSLPRDHWTKWKIALSHCFIMFGDQHRRLIRPLGNWLLNPDIELARECFQRDQAEKAASQE